MTELLNSEAEALLLSYIVNNPESFWSLADIGLNWDDFMGTENRKIFRAIQSVTESRKNPDLPIIIENLQVTDPLTVQYLEKLNRLSCTTAQAFEYGKTVKGLATSRHLVQAGAKIAEIARDKRADSNSAIAEAEMELRRVRETLPAEDRSPEPSDIIRRLRSSKIDSYIPIKFLPSLNKITGGLIPGHLWVIGGFSSMGKSAVLVNLALDALRARKHVGIMSIEMTQEAYLIRFLSTISAVPQKNIRDGILLESHVAAIKDAEEFMSRAPLRVYDTLYRLADIRNKAIEMSQTVGLDMLAIDFIQNVSVEGDEVSDARATILELQNLAKQLNCTVIALSQVSNEMAKSWADNSNQSFYSFKGHGAIRDAADVAIMLKRERGSSNLDIQILKHRHGDSGIITAHFDLPTGRITEISDWIEGEDDDAPYRKSD